MKERSYSKGYKLTSVLTYVAASIAMEEMNQVLYRTGFKYIYFTMAVQQLFILLMFPICATIGKNSGIDFMKQFELSVPTLKQVTMLSFSAFFWTVNVALGRLVSLKFGSGPVDVMRSLIVPFSAVAIYMYQGKTQTKTCIIGILIMGLAFIVNLGNLFGTTTDADGNVVTGPWSQFMWNLALGIGVGLVASHQTLISQDFLRYVEGNAMKMMLLHTPWAILYFGILSFINGEFDGYDKIFGVPRPSYATADNAECFGIIAKFRAESFTLVLKFFMVVVMGFLVNIATMNLLQSVSVVTNNVTSQMKSALGSIIGFSVNFFATGTVPTMTLIIATIIKSTGGAVYTTGKIHAIKQKDKEKDVATKSFARSDSIPPIKLSELGRRLSMCSVSGNAEDLMMNPDAEDVEKIELQLEMEDRVKRAELFRRNVAERNI